MAQKQEVFRERVRDVLSLGQNAIFQAFGSLLSAVNEGKIEDVKGGNMDNLTLHIVAERVIPANEGSGI